MTLFILIGINFFCHILPSYPLILDLCYLTFLLTIYVTKSIILTAYNLSTTFFFRVTKSVDEFSLYLYSMIVTFQNWCCHNFINLNIDKTSIMQYNMKSNMSNINCKLRNSPVWLLCSTAAEALECLDQ
jgi:hypothetical protein